MFSVTGNLWLCAFPHTETLEGGAVTEGSNLSLPGPQGPFSISLIRGTRAGTEKAWPLELDRWCRLCDLREIASPLWTSASLREIWMIGNPPQGFQEAR